MYIGNAATGAVFNKDTVLRCSHIIILEFKFSCLVYVLGISMRILRCFGGKLQLVKYVADISSFWTFRSCFLLSKCEASYNNAYQNIIVILYYDNLFPSFATGVSQLKIWNFWVIGIERNVCRYTFIPLNPELNPICYLLALLAHHFLHVSRIRVKSLTIRLLMSFIYIYIYIYIYIWSTYSWCF